MICEVLNQPKIIIKPLNMNEDWSNIKSSLNIIANKFKENSYQQKNIIGSYKNIL